MDNEFGIFSVYIDHLEMQKDDDKVYVVVHHLVGYCPTTLGRLNAMGKKIVDDFPQATIDEVSCGIITECEHIKGFTVVRWRGYDSKSRLRLLGPNEYQTQHAVYNGKNQWLIHFGKPLYKTTCH